MTGCALHEAFESSAESAVRFVADGQHDSRYRVVGVGQFFSREQHSPLTQVIHRRGADLRLELERKNRA